MNAGNFVRWLAWALKWLAAAAAAGNVSRLSTPDTSAGPWDYLLYVGGPAALAPVFAAAEWLSVPPATARPATADIDPAARDRRDVGLVVARMVADGKHDAASALIAALKQGGGK